MTRLKNYAEPYVFVIAAAVLLLFFQAMCDLALPDFMSDIVNQGIANGDSFYIIKTGLEMLGVSILSTVFSVSVGYLASRVAAGISKAIRKDLFEKVETFSNAEFDKFSTSSLITRTTNDITQIQMLTVMLIRIVFYAPIMGIGGVVHALANSRSMSWIIFVAVVVLSRDHRDLIFPRASAFQAHPEPDRPAEPGRARKSRGHARDPGVQHAALRGKAL